MKFHHHIALVLILLIQCAFVGCIHTYPTPGEEENPTLVDVEVRLNVDDVWEAVQVETENVKSSLEPDLRVCFLIERNGIRIACYEFAFSVNDLTDRLITLPAQYRLASGRYEFYACVDRIDAVSHNPLAYDISDLTDIKPLYENGTYSKYHDLLVAATAVDVSDSAIVEGENLIAELTASHSCGRLQIVATDYADFYSSEGASLPSEAGFYATVIYQDAVPSAFNLIEDSPIRPVDNLSFSTPVELTSLPVEEMIITSDRLFLPRDEMDFHISVSLFNEAKAMVSQVNDIKVPMKRGCTTTVKGNFFTNRIAGGISVDPSWSEEIDIYVSTTQNE